MFIRYHWLDSAFLASCVVIYTCAMMHSTSHYGLFMRFRQHQGVIKSVNIIIEEYFQTLHGVQSTQRSFITPLHKPVNTNRKSIITEKGGWLQYWNIWGKWKLDLLNGTTSLVRSLHFPAASMSWKMPRFCLVWER